MHESQNPYRRSLPGPGLSHPGGGRPDPERRDPRAAAPLGRLGPLRPGGEALPLLLGGRGAQTVLVALAPRARPHGPGRTIHAGMVPVPRRLGAAAGRPPRLAAGRARGRAAGGGRAAARRPGGPFAGRPPRRERQVRVGRSAAAPPDFYRDRHRRTVRSRTGRAVPAARRAGPAVAAETGQRGAGRGPSRDHRSPEGDGRRSPDPDDPRGPAGLGEEPRGRPGPGAPCAVRPDVPRGGAPHAHRSRWRAAGPGARRAFHARDHRPARGARDLPGAARPERPVGAGGDLGLRGPPASQAGGRRGSAGRRSPADDPARGLEESPRLPHADGEDDDARREAARRLRSGPGSAVSAAQPLARFSGGRDHDPRRDQRCDGARLAPGDAAAGHPRPGRGQRPGSVHHPPRTRPPGRRRDPPGAGEPGRRQPRRGRGVGHPRRRLGPRLHGGLRGSEPAARLASVPRPGR